MKNDDFYWYWYANIPHISRGVKNKILSLFESPMHIFYATEEQLIDTGMPDKTKEIILNSKLNDNYCEDYKKLGDKAISFVHREHKDFPKRILQLEDCPIGLYYKGQLPNEERKSIAIIGARNCTRYGTEMARYFARELAKCNINIISGLARGIDGWSHRGALEANGYTLGVLGGGIDNIYPRENYDLFINMESRGGIVSESNIGIKPYAALFPQRNRLISGFSDGILVVQAEEKSGTLITVDQGLEQGKDIFAIPGRVLDEKSYGCNQLIKMGAYLVTEIDDILQVISCDFNSESSIDFNNNNPMLSKTFINIEEKMSLAPVEKMVYSCLQIEPKYIDDIIDEVKAASWEVTQSLNHLVLLGLISETSMNYYGIKI